ncbi:hypothetical protein BUALT_Bualt13G0114200 [Buddleja alternifolia]|uniref:UBC core domain-containing protein n=1 Tax=Buddleja alternifolia TaxID=168488 RepID=A0AAV6WVM0_9LAMI|nr:hypothetical protein BUALT_Bualt13G0114200 [Buddleja alternifolia]
MGELQKQSFVDEIAPVLEDIYHWHGTILGPPNSPFSGGKFVLNINFQPEHPFKAPRLLDSIRSMLIESNLDEAHPDVPDTAEMYKNDRAMYDSTAQSWTELYAMEKNSE